MLEQGTVYTFPLPNGHWGACRVMRAPSLEDQGRGHQDRMLIGLTRYVGESPPDQKHPDLLKLLPNEHRLDMCYWIRRLPPPEFQLIGTVRPPKSDATKTCHAQARWSELSLLALEQWRVVHDQKALDADRARLGQQAATQEAVLTEDLLKNERIDLAGFVHLPIPKSDREPAVVLNGFIAAMSQLEQECWRIYRKYPQSIPLGVLYEPAKRQIFEEFCTSKNRTHSFACSFGKPLEYDSMAETIIRVVQCSSRRVEIETLRTDQIWNHTYVLLKEAGAWLIDSKKVDGKRSIL